MIACLLLGNLLMVAIAAAASMYSHASLQRALTRNLSSYMEETGVHPGVVAVDATYRHSENHDAEENAKAFQTFIKSEQLLKQATKKMEIPVLFQVTSYQKSASVKLADGVKGGVLNTVPVTLTAQTDLDEHIQITKGNLYAKELNENNTIEVIVSEKMFKQRQLMLNYDYEMPKLTDANGKPYALRIVGIFTNTQEQDPYWTASQSQRSNVCMMDYDLFTKLFVNPEETPSSINATWHTVLDYTKFEETRIEEYIDTLQKLEKDAKEIRAVATVNCISELTEFIPEHRKLNTTIWVLLLPILILLGTFVFMVSRQMLEMEENEISVYKSRGASKRQIIWVYFLQSACVCAAGLIGGIPLGILLCRVLGASNAFLEFVRRTALPIKLSPDVWMFAGFATLFSLCTMVLPVFRYAKVDIVDHKRQKNRISSTPFWQKLLLDAVLLGTSAYGLYQYSQEKEFLAQRVLEGASLDPLLYICSSLFMLGCALVIVHLFPLLLRLIFYVGKKWWSPSIYASFLRVTRTNNNQGFLMVFLILMVALGIYNSLTARTINANAEDRIHYMAGADIVLQEPWNSTQGKLATALGSSETTVKLESGVRYKEPDFTPYLNLDGVKNMTRVFAIDGVSVSVNGPKINNATLMGIHTKEFGETAWFKENLLPYHYHEYLNALSKNPSAILVSSNFRDLYDCEIGDVLFYASEQLECSSQGIIYGFIDYWPTYAPTTVTMDSTGQYVETDNFLIVAHLSHLQSAWGVKPYQIWIDAEDSTQFIYDYAAQTDTQYMLFRDSAAQLINLKNDPIFQGTNGILTIGFVCILLLCSIGFLIYWILSIQSRTLQFGIFRAMGMTVREVFAMLICEQIFITGVSLGAGVLVGILTSKLFVPLVQIAYSSADQVIPIEIISKGSDFVRLFAVIGAVILICMGILIALVSKIKISQALKLGED